MMQGAKSNNFPIAVTACLMEKLRKQIKDRAGQEGADKDDLIDCHSLRRRALAMFVVCFSISFAFYVHAFSTAQYNEYWIPCFTVVVTLATYVAMHFLIAGVALVTVLTACFLLTGFIQCVLSIAAATEFDTITKALLVLSKGISNVLLVHCYTYVLELFPSAVRAGAACWAFASGRVSAIFAAMTFVLKPAGREDVVFAVCGTVPLCVPSGNPRPATRDGGGGSQNRRQAAFGLQQDVHGLHESERSNSNHYARGPRPPAQRAPNPAGRVEDSGSSNSPGNSSMSRRSHT
ncbi:hypothetical protein HPB49_026439 [Dermacentor silvarum]|nr:hypothetical protein HPB49_026439 [Dermacentor silvarum]